MNKFSSAWSQRWSGHLPVVLLFVALAMGLLASRGMIVTRTVHDLYYVFDASWRAYVGQVPHLEFHSPIGQAFYWPFALLAPLGEPTALSLFQANVLIALVLLVVAMATLRPRLPGFLYLLAAASVITLAIAPRDMDFSITDYSHLAPYNRWASSFLMMLALLVFVPRPGAAAKWVAVDGIVLGLVLWLLYYLKITFFAGGIGLVGAGFVLRQLRLASLPWLMATLLTAIIGVELVFGNNREYLADLWSAINAHAPESTDRYRLNQLRLSVAVGAVSGSLIAAYLWFLDPSWRLGQWLGRWWKVLLIAAGVIATGAVIGMQNHPEIEFSLHAAAAIIAIELARRQTDSQNQDAQFRWMKKASKAVLLVAVAFMPLLDGFSVFAHAAESRSRSVCPLPGATGTGAEMLLAPNLLLTGSPRLENREKSGLRLIGSRPGAFSQEESAPCGDDVASYVRKPGSTNLETVELQRLTQGIQLVKRNATNGDAVLAIDFANPYPFIFRSRPPAGALIWWDPGRSFSTSFHPPAAPLVESTTIILQMHPAEEKTLPMWQVYGPGVVREFQVADQSSLWRLWKKLPARAPRL